jgi:murein DD-endopeptidase MepM/ murein hydrolase activator NlpD
LQGCKIGSGLGLIDAAPHVYDNSALVISRLLSRFQGHLAVLFLLPLLLVACTADLPESVAESPAAVATGEKQAPRLASQSQAVATPAALLTATATSAPQSTKAAPPQMTAVPTVAPTLTLAPTLTPTTVPTATLEPSPTTEPARLCPETPPLKPIYDRFYLSPQKWPVPDDDIAETHFWLSRPLPGAGRVLTNQRFPYGWDENGRLLIHNGADMAEDLGTPVLAVADGTVIVAQSDYSAWYGWRCDWYGQLVVLELDQRWQDQPVYALYGHILNIKVEPGQRVKRGDQVAEVGFGGAATNPHLHFEVRVGENEFGATRNPMLWLDPGPTRGVIAGRLVDPEGRPWQGVPLALVSLEQEGSISPGWSYLGDPQGLMNPDEGWAENFVFSDVPPGRYEIVTEIQGVGYKAPVLVAAGEVAVVEMVTEGYKTPTPVPAGATVPPPVETVDATPAAQ